MQLTAQGTPSAIPLASDRSGLLRVVSSTELTAKEQAEKAALEAQNQPVMTSLAAHINGCWEDARNAKETAVMPRILKNLRQRRGEYDPDKLTEIRKTGGSEIFMMLTSVKCRAASAWLRDVLLGQGQDKPWTLEPTKVPDLDQQLTQGITDQVVAETAQAIKLGMPIAEGSIVDRLGQLRDLAQTRLREEAKIIARRMENQMEDQLQEGGFLGALDQFIDDITTYPAAFIKGPIIRRKTKLAWVNNEVVPQDYLCKEWERVDPKDIYPSRTATCINDGYLIEMHHLSRSDLNELIGVEGYNEDAIRLVLDEYGRGGLVNWTTSAQTVQQIQNPGSTLSNPEGLIDALQYWGSVQGRKLIEWGMSEKEVPDADAEYRVEAWLIGRYVIRAVLNYDPLGRKPYYKASYEELPGSFWGNAVVDLIADVQAICNAAARSLVNNMGLASGPMVGINTDRMPPGESITTLYPWRIFQFLNDPLGSTAPALEFFQPKPMVNELLVVFEKFSALADEYSGIPRYMTGNIQGVSGAGRTASGMSMMVNNAGKSIKQVVGNIDINVFTPLLEQQYYHNMRFADERTIKGDVRVVARGALSILAKEALQLRRNEFLQATANPVDLQVTGLDGRAYLLREVARTLDMDTDKVVPSPEVMRARQQMQAMEQYRLQRGDNGELNAVTAPGGQQFQIQRDANGMMTGMARMGAGQTLMNGAPVTDNFSPMGA